MFHLPEISPKFADNCVGYPAERLADRQTIRGKNITSLAELTIKALTNLYWTKDEGTKS